MPQQSRIGLLVGALVAGLVVAAPAAGQAPVHKVAYRPSSGAFDLFGGGPGSRGVRLNANRVDCNGIVNYGLHCFNLSESGTVEGGFWPRGTYNDYVYNGGLQLAAVVPADAGFAWAGDTVGVFIFDERGDQRQGDAVTNIVNSRSASDLAAWPSAAYASDTSLFAPGLIGRVAISDQDTWVRYWDGNPVLRTGRTHLMGAVVDQRTLAYNAPAADRDIVYFLFRIINVTSRLPASYAGLAAYGYSADDQAQLADLGARFQAVAESLDATLQLPDSGYTFQDLYVAYSQDPDVGNPSFNFSTAVLPFNLVAAMKSNYAEPLWMYPADVFGAPFARAPGYEAIQLLKSPDVPGTSPPRAYGISVWGNTCSGCGLINAPIGVAQLYRYLSGRISSALGDGQCNADPLTQHTCAALQAYAETRYFESTGPVDLAPGHALVLAVAMLYAAPLAAWPATTNGIYAMPAGQLAPYLGTSDNGINTFFPGWPATAETLAVAGTGSGARVCTTLCTQAATIRDPIERPMGWGQFSDANGDGRIEMDEVETARLSLLNKAQVAQAIFDHKFLVPAAPLAPNFYLLPGDGQVTVAWQKSASETGGDPYFALASDPTSPLYDPDYRKFDVEGYRIWRGTSPSTLKVIAQFDYAGTTLTDYTGQVYNSSFPQCAPELGLGAPPACPVDFQSPTAPSVSYDLGGDVVQIPPGGRVRLDDGSVLVVAADTAVTGGGSGNLTLVDNGVPFAYVDQGLTNSFALSYAVTTFDVNSLASGRSSLESPLVPKSVTPRVGSGQERPGAFGQIVLLGAGGDTLTGTMPTLDQNTGIFSGPMPPANGLVFAADAFVPQLMDSGSLTVTVDSVVPGDGWNLLPGSYFLRVESPATDEEVRVPFVVDPTIEPDSAASAALALAHASEPQAARFGADSTYTMYGQVSVRTPGTYDLTNWGRGSVNSYHGSPSPGYDPGGYNGPRWWTGTPNDTTTDPNGGKCHTAVQTCYPVAQVDSLGLTAGTIPGVAIFHIEAYATVGHDPMRRVHAMAASVARAADMKVYWGPVGRIDSVVDVSNRVPVPFSPKVRASWGILNDSSFTLAGTSPGSTPDLNNGLLTWEDVFCVDPAPAVSGLCTGTPPATLMDHARLSPVYFGTSPSNISFAATPPTGNGFIFYIAGHYFLMQMAALPADGTVWTVRTYAGYIRFAPGSFRFYAAVRPAAVPGLRLRVSFTGSVVDPKHTTAAGLAAVHTVPDPFYSHSGYETVAGAKQIRFVNLPAQCVIRIYSTSGILVRVLTHNDATGGGEEPWDVLSRNGELVASGVYFYHVQAADGRSRIGRMTVVNMLN
jgi:hypothetical protein